MTTLHWAILLYIPFVRASSLVLNGTSIPTFNTNDCPSISDSRTVWAIIWSCCATLFAWTWTAIHPNIPGIKDKKFTILRRRLSIMIKALFIPELIITWAALQFFSARHTAKEFNETFGPQHVHPFYHRRGESAATPLPRSDELPVTGTMALQLTDHWQKSRRWTVTHGFFAWMGGFVLYVDGKPPATLTPNELLRFVREKSVDIPDITEADIDDRSKGDGLSKGIAVLQLAWFILQFIARLVQNLQTSLFEFDTMAVAALICIAQCLWWKKPKDVRLPYPIRWKKDEPPSDLCYDKEDEDFRGSAFRLIHPFISLTGIDHIVSPSAVRSRRAPSVGGYDTSHGGIITLLIGCFSGLIFGGIHCLGWKYLFRREAERLLWRWASLVITCAPVILLLNFGYHKLWAKGYESKAPESNALESKVLVTKAPESRHGHSADDVILIFLLIAAVITFIIYIVARVLLIVLILLSLLSLPPGVYDTVTWTKFVPHW